jgi:hypothetical protein
MMLVGQIIFMVVFVVNALTPEWLEMIALQTANDYSLE